MTFSGVIKKSYPLDTNTLATLERIVIIGVSRLRDKFAIKENDWGLVGGQGETWRANRS